MVYCNWLFDKGFFRLAKSDSQDEVEDLVIRFIISQKERIDRAEITAGTLRNYVKAIKLFCKMNDIVEDILEKYHDGLAAYENIKSLTL